MPEGHVTHRLARTLTADFGGRRVRVSSPQGRFAEAAALLDGTLCQGAEAVGKHLFVTFAGDRIVWIHLGLIGKLQFGPDEVPASPATLRLRIAAGGVRADLRGPQWCRLITVDERDAVAAASGPDPLRGDADAEVAWAKLHRSRKPIGALLMDQALFAGVGNIYRAEVLFRHGIDPLLPGVELGRATFDSIWADLVALMALGVRDARIDTVEPDHTPEAMGRAPRVDRHGGEVYVYRRAGDPCLRCGTPVARAELAGRNLYWCPSCQPAGASGGPR
jgi:formamidopyrimidine-DNA glycosylase